jgi:hypothetical protein
VIGHRKRADELVRESHKINKRMRKIEKLLEKLPPITTDLGVRPARRHPR